MRNPFKKMMFEYEVPKALKQKVLDDIYRIQFSKDKAHSFVIKYVKT
jgi:hypothetical protein